MKLKDFDVSKIYDIHFSITRGELVQVYGALMKECGYPDHFWEGKSPSCEVEEFMKMLWKIINHKVRN